MVNIKNFFEPKSIAIIGASDHIEKVGGILLSKAVKSSAKIFPISLNHDELLGIKCYKSVLKVKEKINLAVIAIPASFVAKSMEECGKKGIKEVILISAGFSEVGNMKDEEEVLRVAKKYGIRFSGANCFGTCNPWVGLDLTFANSMAEKGDIAFVSQSGAMWSYVADLKGGFGISAFVGLGNMDNMDFNDFIEYFGKDKKTKSIVLYVEKLKDGKRFLEACKKAIKNGKRIYAIKGGSSDAGERAAISHTASLASDYAIYTGAFRQAGVEMCENFLEMFEASFLKKKASLETKEHSSISGDMQLTKASGIKRNIRGNKIKVGKSAFIITNAGGAGVLLSDYLVRRNVKIVDKSLDIIGTALAEDYMRNFNEIKNKSFETLFVILTPQSMSEMEKTAGVVVKIKEEFSVEHTRVSAMEGRMKKELAKSKRNVVAVFLGEKSMKEANKIFEKNGVEFVNGFEEI
jgi:acyl-CoA synthetase (NDP forming)